VIVIIGAGLAGLTLACALAEVNVPTVVFEQYGSAATLAAAEQLPDVVLDADTIAALHAAGLGEVLAAPVATVEAVRLRADSRTHRIALPTTTLAYRPGEARAVAQARYRHADLLGGLLERYIVRGGQPRWLTTAIAVAGLAPTGTRGTAVVASGPLPSGLSANGSLGRQVLGAEWVVAADGRDGLGRTIAANAGVQLVRHHHDVTWLVAVLAGTPPCQDPLYTTGSAQFAAQLPYTATTTQILLQIGPGEDPSAWPEDRMWAALAEWLGPEQLMAPGPVLSKVVAPVVSSGVELMRHGQLLLIGDAAHHLPVVTAKGANLAMHDALTLAAALQADARPDAVPRWERSRTAAAVSAHACTAGILELTHPPVQSGAGFVRSGRRRMLLGDPAARAAFAATWASTLPTDAPTERAG
jgi:p-hydroxybenzoate 3-monooxygenase